MPEHTNGNYYNQFAIPSTQTNTQQQITPNQVPIHTGASNNPPGVIDNSCMKLTAWNPMYVPGYLRQMIGKYIKVEFLIGTNMLIDREGTLKDVGISYIVLKEPETDDDVLCDMFSIKFVRIFY